MSKEELESEMYDLIGCATSFGFNQASGDNSEGKQLNDAAKKFLELIDQYAYEYAERVIKELTLNPQERKSNESDKTALILHNKGYGYGRIARVMGVGKSTAQFFVNRALRNAETELSPHRATKDGEPV